MTPADSWDKYGKQLLEKFVKDDSAPKDVSSLPKVIIDADPTVEKRYSIGGRKTKWIGSAICEQGIKG